ncbi:hypothetical protein HGRIS_014678 [Hohenbuehelia grisea]|uniref:Secreted protein n=1 Tax=Hohenbuehelia grisea TaxID=104357 RepID=A0ABR3JU82_9AGAR
MSPCLTRVSRAPTMPLFVSLHVFVHRHFAKHCRLSSNSSENSTFTQRSTLIDHQRFSPFNPSNVVAPADIICFSGLARLESGKLRLLPGAHPLIFFIGVM